MHKPRPSVHQGRSVPNAKLQECAVTARLYIVECYVQNTVRVAKLLTSTESSGVGMLESIDDVHFCEVPVIRTYQGRKDPTSLSRL